MASELTSTTDTAQDINMCSTIDGSFLQGTGSDSMDFSQRRGVSSFSGPHEDSSSSSNDAGASKKFKRSKEDKMCLVCGDKALGYNFNAITCESCKAFFRRNALKSDQPKCLFQNDCLIDVRTRRFCPHCRLRRCFEVGMKKEMILDETERKARMQKVAMNRQMKQKPSTAVEVIIKNEPSSIESEATSSMPDTQSVGDERNSTAYPTIAFGCSVPLTLPVLSSDSVPKDPRMYRMLSPEEKMQVEELSVAYLETLGGYANETHVNNEESYSSADELVNNSEIAVRRLIKFVKKIAQFRGMSQENQVACLKSCVLNALLLRSVNFYDAENDAWKTPTGSIPTSVLKHATGFNDLHDAHTSYCAGLKKLTRDDSNIMALIQTITVFNPDGQNLENRQIISDIQEHFILLLRHYLESDVSFMHSQVFFSNILQKISELKGLGEDHARILLQINSNKIEPLMLEVLNLQ
ncbi:nuclear hormone receptor HR96-like [Saccostrea echinata]|uniref:nuclear hormone receptor HR96-like n=1 Tax=Saccostrea echinata TaxID=191078 RepID=UPI002A8419DF|nr:nuclear hormone receptor HR96-like [Saccostrea echinata]